MTEQEYLNSISGREDSDYPVVIKVSEPLLIRYNKKSLLVNDTNFYVKIKYGLGFTGYYIYSSGLGTEISTVKRDDLKPKSGGTTKTEERALKELEDGAAELLDILEARIAITVNDNAIKRAIDRLTWQQHYDITHSDTDFAIVFKDEGFSENMTLDYSSSESGEHVGWHDNQKLMTLPKTVQDAADQISGTGGSLSDISSKLTTINNTMITKLESINTSTNKVATNIKGDNDAYTISVALREDSQYSVSEATQERKELENEKFVEISDTKLGNFGGDYRTLFDSMNSKVGQNYIGYSVTTNKTLNQIVGDDTTTNPKYNTGIIDKLGKFGDDIGGSGGSYQYRTLFETFNTQYTDQGITAYKGYSNILYKSLNETVGYVDTNDFDWSDKKSIYTKCTKTVDNSISTDTSNTYTVFGLSNAIKNNLGDRYSTADGSLFAYWNSVYYPVTSGGPSRATLLAFPNTKTWT